MHYSFLSDTKINVWHSIEQRTILTHPLTSVQWHSEFKICICAECGYSSHMV